MLKDDELELFVNELAQRYGIQQRETVRVTTRRGVGDFAANIVETIRKDTVFIPYHWPHGRSASTRQMTDSRSGWPTSRACPATRAASAAPPP